MRKRIKKTVGIMFFISWLLCGCGGETCISTETGTAPQGAATPTGAWNKIHTNYSTEGGFYGQSGSD